VGVVTFGLPMDLAKSLVEAGQLQSAVETGTYLGDSAIGLRSLVGEVWSVELLEEIYAQAVTNVGARRGITLLQGYSPDVLSDIAERVTGPSLFWLDGHGGTSGVPDVASKFKQCPVMEELAAIATFLSAGDACILIDDARAFFGPMLQHNPEEWPTFLEVSDTLRAGGDRYVTVLDDVIIAVPVELRSTVDTWWRTKLEQRHGFEALQEKVAQLGDPAPLEAFLRFGRSLLPHTQREQVSDWLVKHGAKAPKPRDDFLGAAATSAN
jgi:hypothetical protein